MDDELKNRRKRKKLTSKVKVSLVEKFRKASVKIDVPITGLVASGRIFL